MTDRNVQNAIPVAPLRIINLNTSVTLGRQIDEQIVHRRKKSFASNPGDLTTLGYQKDSYLVDINLVRNSTGEGKAVINESIRGADLFIIADVMNYDETYPLHGSSHSSSPDDHYQDLKRVIMACSGHPRRITVIMPYLYEGRQNIRFINESLDCAMVLQELTDMGVSSIVTFDAHDSRVQNAIPLEGFDNFYTSYQFIKAVLDSNENLQVDSDSLMIVSPDEGGINRAVYYATLLGVNMGMFFKRRDYTGGGTGGENPVIAIEFLGNDLSGKDVILVDDMIATGTSVLEACAEIKKRGAAHVYVCATFGLFTKGLEVFDKAYKENLFDRIFTTNLNYCPDQLLDKPYYENVNMSTYLSLIIDTINNDTSVSSLLDATSRIQELLAKRNHTD